MMKNRKSDLCCCSVKPVLGQKVRTVVVLTLWWQYAPDKARKRLNKKIETEPSSGELNKSRSFLHSSLKVSFPNTELSKVRGTYI